MKRTILLFFLTVCCLTSFSQDKTTIEKARQTLEDIINYKGESVHGQMSQNMKAAITPLQLNTLWYTLTLQYGKFIESTDWKEQYAMGYNMATGRLVFEKGELNYIVSYRDQTIEGLLFQPIEKPKAFEAVETGNFKEEDMGLSCDGYHMPAILTVPKGVDNPPCVIIVHGSGPSDMDGNIGKTTIYKDIAHKLAENGIASFRYHKRTYVYKDIPDSIANRITVDFETTDDAVAAAKMLKNLSCIDSNNIFILGHSQGAMMIPRIAQKTDNVRGYVMLSAPTGKILDIIMEQMEYLYKISKNPTWPDMKPELENQIDNFKKLGTDQFNDSIKMPLNLPASYLTDIQNYNQTKEAKKIKAPLLILNGESDYQVTMKDFSIWSETLNMEINVELKSYPGLSHLYTPASNPPSPDDYNKEAEFSDTVIKDISKWIKENSAN